MNTIPIWEPRYHDRKILIKCYKVVDGPNRIIFTRCNQPSLLMDGERIRTYPVKPHGKKPVYEVPWGDFESETNQLNLFGRQE